RRHARATTGAAADSERLQRQRAGADQIREPLALLGIENPVQTAERFHDRVTQTFGAPDAQLRRLLRGRLVELIAAERVGEARERATAVDLRLRALRLQIGEDLRELADLPLVQLELVREEPERPPHADAAVAEAAAR